MTHGFEKEALKEYREAAAWYETQREGLGGEFVAAVESALHDISKNPSRFPPVDAGLRVLLMKRFPYRLIFRWSEKRDHVTIFAVMHYRRKPDYWRHRLSEES